MSAFTDSSVSIDEALAKRLLSVVDAGLVNGMGVPVPGQMCVEAAVCYAMGLPHGDEPSCVSPVLRSLKIRINDSKWSTPGARARACAVLRLPSWEALASSMKGSLVSVS